jgi:hypothetical protein
LELNVSDGILVSRYYHYRFDLESITLPQGIDAMRSFREKLQQTSGADIGGANKEFIFGYSKILSKRDDDMNLIHEYPKLKIS